MSFWSWWKQGAMRVYVARDSYGKILGIYSQGKKLEAQLLTKVPLEEWVIDEPRLGGTTLPPDENTPSDLMEGKIPTTVDEPKGEDPPKIKRKTSIKTITGIFFPGARKHDEKIRQYAGKAVKSTTYAGIVALTMKAVVAMLGKQLEAGSAHQAAALRQQAIMNKELIDLQAQMNRDTLLQFKDLVAVHATDSASWAIVANRIGILLDRGAVKVEPAKPGHTTIFVEPAPVTVIQQRDGSPPVAIPPERRKIEIPTTTEPPRSSQRRER